MICGNSYKYKTINENAQAAQEEAEQSKADADAAKEAYEDMQDTQDNLQQYVWAASIVVPYEPEEITIRHIKVLREDKNIITIDLVGNDVATEVDEFRKSLTSYIQEHEDRPVILSLNENDDKILFRDEKAVNEVLNELADEYSNVYIK